MGLVRHRVGVHADYGGLTSRDEVKLLHWHVKVLHSYVLSCVKQYCASLNRTANASGEKITRSVPYIAALGTAVACSMPLKQVAYKAEQKAINAPCCRALSRTRLVPCKQKQHKCAG